MARSTEEWIGKSDDHKAPPKVRDRIRARHNCCHLCGQPIQIGQKSDLDHVVALINGGENRESNLRPAHRKCHVEKTKLDVAEKARIARIRQKHLGLTAPKQSIPGRPFPKSEQAAKRQSKADALRPLPRRALYEAKETI